MSVKKRPDYELAAQILFLVAFILFSSGIAIGALGYATSSKSLDALAVICLIAHCPAFLLGIFCIVKAADEI